MPLETVRLIIHGRVQGVAYRESMCQAARALGVAGWVRNRTDGTVEALLQGEAAACDRLQQWAAQGPPLARVSRVERAPVEPAHLAGLTGGFERRPTVV